MAEPLSNQCINDGLGDQQESIAERRGLQESGDAASTSQKRGTEQDGAGVTATFQGEMPGRRRTGSASRDSPYQPEGLQPQAEVAQSGNGDYSPGDPGDCPDDALAALAAAARDDVVGQLPRYAAPSLASCLPAYRNEEQEFILRTFAGGNYDMLRHLPDSIREQQVLAARSARQEAARTFLLPGQLGSQLRLRSGPPNQQGLFTAFEYIPSRYSLAAELASKERVASEATRLTIGRGQEFKPVVAQPLQKQQEIGPKTGYVYLAGPYEDTEDLRLSERSHTSSSAVNPPFIPAGCQKLGADVPTRPAALEMMKNTKRALEADWEGAVISLFENEHDCWVVCFQEASVDGGLAGLSAYMNVFVRTNPVATEYRLTKVVEYWSCSPGDGCVYFVMRPPWVAPQRLETFFTLHPEERDWRTSFPVAEMEAVRRARRKALDAGDDELEVDQRMRQMSLRSHHSTTPHSGLGSAPASASTPATTASASAHTPASLPLPPLPALPPQQQPQNPPPPQLSPPSGLGASASASSLPLPPSGGVGPGAGAAGGAGGGGPSPAAASSLPAGATRTLAASAASGMGM
ncbi:hypothetical protein Agub_g2691 [Astrephomene gubernaculifera]|uniref:Uncharacterized protein n=1 Tax=Astrephomene gubernaculifera TaxID=47775 RepID=A0AAD3HIK6_9CHLO|nr:hypothetical protein Agub_g2691 [Astrephomene gubernaculifera]